METKMDYMGPLKNILLATDGSEYSEGAVREAISLAKRCSSKLFALSVVEANPEFMAMAPQAVEDMEVKTREYLESIKSRASKEGVQCESIVHEGEDTYKFIVDEAKKNNVNMIVMGRRGRKGLKRLMMGSVTAKTIGHSPCNVLVVPRAARIEGKVILIATDGSKYSELAAREAVYIAKGCESKLIAVSVASSEAEVKESQDNVNKVRDMAEREGVKAEILTVTGRPYEAIVETAKNKNADLIIVGSHGKTGLERLLMGSVTERVIGLTEVAVLVVKVQA